jgi:hypothetical protein
MSDTGSRPITAEIVENGVQEARPRKIVFHKPHPDTNIDLIVLYGIRKRIGK